jgi:hypothetical protein
LHSILVCVQNEKPAAFSGLYTSTSRISVSERFNANSCWHEYYLPLPVSRFGTRVRQHERTRRRGYQTSVVIESGGSETTKDCSRSAH